MAVKVQFEIGHTSKLRSKKTPEGFTHDWELYVKGVSGADISCFVEKVIFNLHESFPKPKRVCKEPPYMIQESGYAGFMLPIDIYFRIRDEPKRVQFNYDLDLQQTGPPQHRCDIQKFIFDNPSEEFRLKLLKGGGVPVSGVVPGTSTATMVPSAMVVDNHKPLQVTEIKKHKSRSDESKLPTFTNLFGTPITKGASSTAAPSSLSAAKHSPDSKPNPGNTLSSKSSINITNNNSGSATSSREKSSKDKDKSTSSSTEKSRERSERKEKHHKQSANSPHKEARSGESKRSESSKHDKRDKNEEKPKKDKSRDKDKERSREKGATIANQLSSSTSIKRLNSPKREISPLKSSQGTNNISATLTAPAVVNHPSARPSSSNSGRLDNEQKSSSKSSKDNLNEPLKSKESKKDSSSSSSNKKSKREKRDKEKDKERDKEKKHEDKDKHKAQNPIEVIAAATSSALQTEKVSKPIITTATTATSNGTSPEVANSKNRDKTIKIDSKTTEKTIDKHAALSNSTLSVGAGGPNASCLPTNSVNEKAKNSNSNNSSASNVTAANGSEKDKRSHKHKKKEKNKDKDRERDKEREREKDKEKDAKKETKEIKDKLEKPDDKTENFIDSKISTQSTSSPSLTQSLEETPTITPTPSSASVTSNSNSTATTKKSQNKEKKSREKATSREEKNKHKLQEVSSAGPKTKQTKLSSGQSNVSAATSMATTKPTITATTTTAVTTSNIQTNNQMELSDSGSAIPMATTEQQSLNRNTTLPNKTQSTLQHSDSSNSSFPDLLVKPANIKQDSSKNNAASSTKTVKTTKERPTDKSADNKAEKEDKKRRRNSVVANTFIEPPLKQSKKEANKNTREKSKSPSLRNASTKPTMAEIISSFLQPSPSPSNMTVMTASNTLPTPPPTATAPSQANIHSPALNINESLANINCPTPLSVTNTQQQQSTVVGSAPGPQPPPPLSLDYWSELQELHQKIMSLQDNEDLQQVVELIASTGCYEITTKTFDFDLCKLDRNTVQRLQDFFATSVS
uniref:YEATS domain-containing protein n=1 Tax=Glossina brevipalpis TaxID=37001 RepID=A0A1A9X1X8_9MUSC